MPSFRIKGKYVEGALTYAVTNVIFTRMSNNPINNFDNSESSVKLSKNYLFYEPGFTFKAGAKNFKLFGQFVFCQARLKSDLFEKGKLSFGLVYQFHNWRK